MIEKQINDTQAHLELSDNNTRDAEKGCQPPPLQEEWMLIPVLLWDLKSQNASEIISDFSQSQLSLPLIHQAQRLRWTFWSCCLCCDTIESSRSASLQTQCLASACISKVNDGGGTFKSTTKRISANSEL